MSQHDFQQQLRQTIGRHFNLDELQQLVFDLNLDWDELAGSTKSSKIVALVGVVIRHGRLPDLLAALQTQRPAVHWPEPSPVEAIVKEVRQGNIPDLSGAMLRRASLDGADLGGVNLRGASLRWAKLYLANLSGADLRDADLRRAKMRKANLSQADLRGAKLNGADFRLANLRGAKVAADQLALAKLSGAILPNGRVFDPERPLSEQLT